MARNNSHGPGQGPAKGKGTGGPARAFTADYGPENLPKAHQSLREKLRERRERLEAEGLYEPKQRTANNAELREMARAAAPEIMRGLIDIAINEPNPETRIKASDKVLERGYGKAAQPIDLAVNPTEMTDEQLAAIAFGGSESASGTPPDTE